MGLLNVKEHIKERRAHLIEQCPALARYVAAGYFDECYDYSIGEGWTPLIVGLMDALTAVGGEGTWRVAQVKEKFGTLRFYIYGGTEEMHDMIWKV